MKDSFVEPDRVTAPYTQSMASEPEQTEAQLNLALHSLAPTFTESNTRRLAAGASEAESWAPNSNAAVSSTHPDSTSYSAQARRPTVAVLAVQGAFIEHERKLEHLGARCIELRCAEDLDEPFDALVLPGGESTVQGKLLRELGMEEPLRRRIQNGMPVLATCAGMILLAERIESEETRWLSTIPMTVRRNAYGRQLGSFHCEGKIAGLGSSPFTAPFTFIRAPFVTEVGPGVEVLATVNNAIVAIRFENQIALAFHPELDESNNIHQAFLDLIG